MTAAKCHRCGKWWTFTLKNRDRFRVITKFCPNCVLIALPLMGEA